MLSSAVIVMLCHYTVCMQCTTRSSAIAVIADRTTCSILTLFIAITTCRPLNKEIRSLSVRGSNCGSASAIRSPHTTLSACHDGRPQPARRRPAVMVQCCVSSLTNEAWRFDDHAHVLPESIVYTYGVSHFFVMHFVAKRYILEQKYQKGRIGTLMLGSR